MAKEGAMLARGILLTLLVVAGCGTSRPVSLDGAVDMLDALVCAPGLTESNGKCMDTGTDGTWQSAGT